MFYSRNGAEKKAVAKVYSCEWHRRRRPCCRAETMAICLTSAIPANTRQQQSVSGVTFTQAQCAVY